MPAYRSDAEGLVRTAVVAKLREFRPNARIIHEINNGAFNRLDLIAVSPVEIIAVEIKSEKDTLDLLAAQYEGMRRVAHHIIIAYHEKHDVDGFWSATKWRFPEGKRNTETWDWQDPRLTQQVALPTGALDMIWKEELLQICRANNLGATTRWTCKGMRRAIRWNLTGEQMTRAICAALRSRVCIEAEPLELEGFKLK